jgi:DNA topoisomerase IB
MRVCADSASLSGSALKGSTRVRTTLVDHELADAVRALLKLPGGSRLFRFENAGEPTLLTAPLLNACLAEDMGGGFTAKDFRTWGGTLTAAIALAEHGPAESEAQAKHVVASAMRRVGVELGNTPSVARSSMPDKRPSVKNEKQYEALKDKGMSKERAARIANSPGASSRGGKSSGSGGSSTQGGTTAQKKAAGRKGGRATARKRS